MFIGSCQFFSDQGKRFQEINIEKDSSKFTQKHVFSRLCYAAQSVLSLVAATVDVTVGIFLGLLSLAFLGKIENLNGFSIYQLQSSSNILREPFENLIKALNPKAEFDPTKSNAREYCSKICKEWMQYDAKSFNLRTRLLAPVYLTLVVAGAIFDILAGIVAVPLCVLTIGKINRINDVAANALSATFLLHEVIYSALLILKPSSVCAAE